MSSSDDGFAALRRLVRLKRHELPPPGFFDALADRIRAQLESGEAPATLPWWRQGLAFFDLKPALAGAFGLAVLGMYLLGLSLGNYRADRAAAGTPPVVWVSAMPAPVSPRVAPATRHALLENADPGAGSSMNPVINAAAPRALFVPGAGLRRQGLQRVNFVSHD